MDDLDLGATITGLQPDQKLFGRYTLIRQLGRGGMGVVWLARDGTLAREAALKFVPEVVAGDRVAIEGLRREVRRAIALAHPHIVKVHDFVTDGRTAAVSMEYIAGDTLASLRLDEPGQVFAADRLAPWVAQLCNALDYAHHKGRIVHRDLKPGNLMIDAEGDLKVLDFGLAATLAESVSQVSRHSSGSGTLAYMSPQQLRGVEDPGLSDDLYALGATLYDLLAGQPPFRSTQASALMHQVLNEPPQRLNQRRAKAGQPAVPPEWEETIMALLAKEPADRPQSAGEIAERLRLTETRGPKADHRGQKGRASGPDESAGAAATSPRTECTEGGASPVQPQTQSLKSKTPIKILLIASIAASVLLLFGAGYYFGVYAPEQKRLDEAVHNQSLIAAAEFAYGALELASTPAGAEVWQNGLRVGVTPYQRTDAIPGRYDFELKLKGYQPATAGLAVAARQTIRATVALEKLSGSQTGQAWTIPDLSLTLQPIAPGTFQMGSASGGGNYERPVTRATLTKHFWLGQTEVTQAQWSAVMGSNPSHFKGDNLPVEQVSWNDAMEFCRKLTERERAAGRLPGGYAYTLPTEAQWEYACRSGTTGDYAGNLDAMGWYNVNSGNTTKPVGTKQANAWGLQDMHGNVWEWCADWYGNYPGGGVTDPTGASSGTGRVNRGGSWDDSAGFCRSAFRAGGGPGNRIHDLGFRLALSSVQ